MDFHTETKVDLKKTKTLSFFFHRKPCAKCAEFCLHAERFKVKPSFDWERRIAISFPSEPVKIDRARLT